MAEPCLTCQEHHPRIDMRLKESTLNLARLFSSTSGLTFSSPTWLPAGDTHCRDLTAYLKAIIRSTTVDTRFEKGGCMV